jgi:hypothetical protein
MGANAKSVTIAGIERTTTIAGVMTAVAFYFCSGPAMAVGAAIGCAFIVANLFLLAIVGRGVIAMSRGGGGLSLLGILLIPIKLLFFIGVSYLIVSRLKVDVAAFVLGVLTQPTAMLIELWRAAPDRAFAQTEIKGNKV